MYRNQTTNALLVGSITLTPTLVEPLYQQLFQQLRQLIVTGRLQPSARLPSSRQLALDLKVSRTTSVNAYQQLQSEGLLISRQGAGIYVNHSLPKSTQPQTLAATNKALPAQLEANPSQACYTTCTLVAIKAYGKRCATTFTLCGGCNVMLNKLSLPLVNAIHCHSLVRY